MDKIIIERHPSKIDKDGRRHYLIRAVRTKILSKSFAAQMPGRGIIRPHVQGT